MICFSWSAMHFTLKCVALSLEVHFASLAAHCTPYEVYWLGCIHFIHCKYTASTSCRHFSLQCSVHSTYTAMQQCSCSICTSEVVQCIEVLHCTGTVNALHLRCTSIWDISNWEKKVESNRLQPLQPFHAPPLVLFQTKNGSTLHCFPKQLRVESFWLHFFSQYSLIFSILRNEST